LKTKWCAGTLNSKNNVLDKFKRLKMLLKLRVIRFSNVSRLKRTSEEPKRSSKRTCAMNFISKKVNRQLLLESVLS
jgi:hypothetical protein